MKHLSLTITCAVLAAALPASGQAAGRATDRAPDAQLARALEGRVAGDPVDCIPLRSIRSSRIIDKTAILFEGPGDVLYVNYPDAGAEALDNWAVQVTDTRSSRLCSIDTVHLYDHNFNSFAGVVFLGKFVPYRKVAAAAH